MKTYLSLLPLFCFSLWLMFSGTQCQSHYASLSVTEIGKITLVKPEKDASVFACRPVESGKCLACAFMHPSNPMKRSIIIYDMEKAEIQKVIPLPKEIKNQCMLNFAYINRDSLLVQTSYTENKELKADSTLFLMNDEGKLLKIYNLDSTPSSTYNNSIKPEENCPSLSNHALTGLAYYDGKVYFETVCGVLGLNKDLIKKPILGEFDLKSETFRPVPVYYHPVESYDFFWGDQHIGCPPTMDWRGNILINAGFSPHIQVWNAPQTRLERHYSPTRLFDSILPMTAKWNGNVAAANKYSSLIGNYGLLFANPIKQEYVRIMNLPPRGKNIKEKNKSRLGITLMDSNLTPYAEGEITDLAVYPFGFSPLGILAYDNASLSNPDSITLKILVTQLGENNTKNILRIKNDTQKENFVGYLQRHQSRLSLKKNLIIVVPMGNSCSPCLNAFVLDFLAKLPLRNNFDYHFLFIFEDERTKKTYMQNDTLLQNIPYHSEETYKNLDEYVLRFYNPKLYFVRNGKITKETYLQVNNLKSTSAQIDRWIRDK